MVERELAGVLEEIPRCISGADRIVHEGDDRLIQAQKVRAVHLGRVGPVTERNGV